MSTPAVSADEHHAAVDRTSSTPKRILMVVANPSVASTVGWPVGFWAAELTHPYYEFTEAGYEVVIASPQGGKVTVDQLSDPRDESRWSSEDLISMGFLNTPELVALLQDTPRLGDLDLGSFDAFVCAGGLSPMFTFRDDEAPRRAIRRVLRIRAAAGGVLPRRLGAHRRKAVRRLLPHRRQDDHRLLQRRGGLLRRLRRPASDAVADRGLRARARRELHQGALFKPFVVRDGRLITGQQQYSGRKVAQLVIQTLGT